MGTIRFVSEEETTWQRSAAARGESHAAAQPAEAREKFEMREYFRGADRHPELFEVRGEPGARVASHMHDHDEIIYVLQGELRFGKRRYGAGSAVFIEQNTLYAFTVGPEGCRFLNFRPQGNARYIPGKATEEDRSA